MPAATKKPLLIDTDAFCVLGVGNLLVEASGLFGTNISGCARLAPLPYMLRKGRLREHYGDTNCDGLIPVTDQMPVMETPGAEWLDKLVRVKSIDPGEAQLFALAAEKGLHVVTGDKRALRGLADLPEIADALEGRVAPLETILIGLCCALTPPEVERRIRLVRQLNKTIRVCFSPDNPDPVGALRSYYRSLSAEVRPLVLWDPDMEN